MPKAPTLDRFTSCRAACTNIPILLLTLGCGCYAGVKTVDATADTPSNETDAADGSSGTEAATGDDGGSSTGGGLDESACRVHQSPLRRLTTAQYINTIGDLFPNAPLQEVQNVFPEEDSVHGFENAAHTQVPSPALIEGYQRAALTVVMAVFEDRAAFETSLGTPFPDDREAATSLAAERLPELGKRILRRPLTTQEEEHYNEVFATQFEDTGALDDDVLLAFSMTISALLQAPDFIYLLEYGVGEDNVPEGGLAPLNDWEVASRLSYFLWNTMPDDALFEAAASGSLDSPEALEDQARRLLAHPNARRAVREFHRQWLDADRVRTQPKDPDTYPDWTTSMAAAASEQVGQFAEFHIFEGDGNLHALLAATEVPLHADLEGLFDADATGAWDTVDLDPARRTGILSLPGVLASQAHPVHPSPVLRGQFIRERVLCTPLPPPPPTVDASPPMPDGADSRTNRERYEEISKNATCDACHVFMHGVGFPFESYDSVGAFRLTDSGQPVDTSGELVGIAGLEGPVTGAREVSLALAESEVAAHCMVTQWFRQGFAREPEEDGDACTSDELRASMASSDGDIQELLVDIVRSEDFRTRRVLELGGEE